MIKINKDWKFKESFPKISAYTTAYNCVSGKYPIEAAIRSFSWADEIVVADGGSDDGTRELLEELVKELPQLQVYDLPIDWDNPGKDGQQKAMARAMCSGEFLVQFDADEIACGAPELWKRAAKEMPNSVDILQLFVAEPFGSRDMLRFNESHNPLKWRIYRNRPEINHGIPAHDRLEVDGKVYSKGGSDGCFPVHIVTNQLYPSYTPSTLKQLANLKQVLNSYKPEQGQSFNQEDVNNYKNKVKEVIKTQPFVLHLGHVNLEYKLKLYLNTWHKWWNQLYNNPEEHNIYFPGVKHEEVTEEMISEKIESLKSETPCVHMPELVSLT